MVANSPRIGVGPGFDSQGCVTYFHKYCFPNSYWIHWSITKWSDSANTPTSLSSTVNIKCMIMLMLHVNIKSMIMLMLNVIIKCIIMLVLNADN